MFKYDAVIAMVVGVLAARFISLSATPQNIISTGTAAWDQYDSIILDRCNMYNYPYPKWVKAQIFQESNFNPNAISGDIPCGQPTGWSVDQSKSFGLMQVTPACMLPVGSPPPDINQWMQPYFNIDKGVGAVSWELQVMQQRFPTFTADKLLQLALGAYNSGDSSIDSTGTPNARAQAYITAVTGRYNTLYPNG